MKGVPIQMNSISMKDVGPKPFSGVISDIAGQYQSNLLVFMASQGIVRAVLSLDMIGNPQEVLKNISGGLTSLFIEPAKAVVRGPEEFGSTLASGAVDFGRQVIGGGVFGTASRLTGTVGSLLSTLTGDADYQAERERNLKNTKDLGDGLKKGVFAFYFVYIFLWRRVVDAVVSTVEPPPCTHCAVYLSVPVRVLSIGARTCVVHADAG